MLKTEEYCLSQGFTSVYLTTHDQQVFYSRCGYKFSEAVCAFGGSSKLNLGKFAQSKPSLPVMSPQFNNLYLENIPKHQSCPTKLQQSQTAPPPPPPKPSACPPSLPTPPPPSIPPTCPSPPPNCQLPPPKPPICPLPPPKPPICPPPPKLSSNPPQSSHTCLLTPYSSQSTESRLINLCKEAFSVPKLPTFLPPLDEVPTIDMIKGKTKNIEHVGIQMFMKKCLI